MKGPMCFQVDRARDSNLAVLQTVACRLALRLGTSGCSQVRVHQFGCFLLVCVCVCVCVCGGGRELAQVCMVSAQLDLTPLAYLPASAL
jgi:hypothetical protein